MSCLNRETDEIYKNTLREEQRCLSKPTQTKKSRLAESEELECNESDIGSCLDLQRENPTENIYVESSQHSTINKANEDIFECEDDKTLCFFEAKRYINFRTKATSHSLLEEQPSSEILRELLLSVSRNNYQEANREDKSVISQRGSIRFFANLLILQKKASLLNCRETKSRCRLPH